MTPRVRHGLPCLAALLLPVFLLAPAAHAATGDTGPTIDLSKPNPLPVYPETGKRIGESGTATILVQVGENGVPIAVKLQQSAGFVDLDVAALKAVRQWHFIPATKDGKPVVAWKAVRVQFTPTGAATGAPEVARREAAERERKRVICKHNVDQTGSRIPGPKVCLPQWQWDIREKNAQRNFGDNLSHSSTP